MTPRLGERFSYVRGRGYRPSPAASDGCVYALVDPRSGAIRYVGKTVKHPADRALQHYTDISRTSRDGQRKRNWLLDLRAAGVRPDVLVVDVVPVAVLADAETDYIAAFRALGCDLVNDAGDRKRLSFCR